MDDGRFDKYILKQKFTDAIEKTNSKEDMVDLCKKFLKKYDPKEEPPAEMTNLPKTDLSPDTTGSIPHYQRYNPSTYTHIPIVLHTHKPIVFYSPTTKVSHFELQHLNPNQLLEMEAATNQKNYTMLMKQLIVEGAFGLKCEKLLDPGTWEYTVRTKFSFDNNKLMEYINARR